MTSKRPHLGPQSDGHLDLAVTILASEDVSVLSNNDCFITLTSRWS